MTEPKQRMTPEELTKILIDTMQMPKPEFEKKLANFERERLRHLGRGQKEEPEG
ncbi:MAG: hypothetical protein AAF219_06725 [Myxococcota bacterium]